MERKTEKLTGALTVEEIRALHLPIAGLPETSLNSGCECPVCQPTSTQEHQP